MERHRDIRRGNMAAAAAANGLSRRRQRSSASTTTSNSFRDSPEDDGTIELQETTRLRDRAGKKERDRLNRNKRRRGERLMLGGHRDDGGEESTEDSIDDDDDDEDDESSHIRMRPPNPASSSAHSNHHLHRKSYPPPAAASNKVLRATTWKVSDEMSFSVPKKARSACTKRTHESYISVVGGVSSGISGGGGGGGGGTGEPIHRQASTSPARPSPAPTPAPASPSSSTASIRKKMKPIGAKPKHKPPKPSPIQDDIEIEVAEVLYGLMRQNQCSSRQESVANSSPKPDSREANGSANDAKSRVSSPVSAPTFQSKLPPNSSSTTTPVSVVAPKRKRPRPVKFEDENSANFSNRNDSTSSNKIDSELPPKPEASSTKLEKNSGSNESRTGVALDFGSSQATIAPMDVQEELKTHSSLITESKPPVAEESVVRADDQTNNMVTSPKKESSCSKVDFNPENTTATKATPTSAAESHREEIFKIDLMAPPSKSSPEREGEVGFASESKAMASDSEMKLEPGELKENVDVNCKKDVEAGVVGFDKKTEKATTTVDECESQKPIVQKHTMLDLQIDPPKDNKDCGPSAVRQQQLHTLQQHQQPSKPIRNEPKLELASGAQSASSVPLPMGVTGGWPGGLTPMGNGMGQIRPMLTSLDGTPGLPNATAQPSHQPPTQTRPKRCATHYYIARNIYYHQQFTKMTPFWPAAAGSASMYGNKPYNLNAMPPTENASVGNPPLSGNVKHSSSIQDKGQVDGVKDKSTVAANFLDSSQGKVVPKQMVLQQPPQQLPIQGPALIFPMNQQQAAVASVSKNGAAKTSNTVNASASISVQSAVGAPSNLSASATGPGTMSFSYPNMPGNEAQYVAILQNNGYQFPVPAHVGTPSSYRGTTPPAMPFYNGPFYSSQMMQLQQQQQQQQQQMQQSHSQQQPNQQGHQNASTSSGSSSSQKHQQHNHHQRLQGSGSNAASGTSNSFPASKNRPQKQQNQSFPVTHQQVRHHDTDVAVEDGHSQEDNRLSLANKNAYNHNFAMPAHTKNFTSLSPAPIASGNGNHSDRQQQHHQSSKGGAESTPNQTFAMPFTSFNGATTISGLDFSSMAQNHVIFQSLPDAARHGYQIAAAAAQTAQQKKNHQISEEGKAVNDSNNPDDERKAPAGKGQPSGAQAIVFSRTDASDPSGSTILGNSVVESSARTLNLISSSGNGNRNSRSNTSTSAAPSTATVNASYSQQQQQQQQKQIGQLIQMQQMQQIQLMRQQQMHQQIAAAATARVKPSSTNSANVYTDSVSSSSPIAAKFSSSYYYPEGLIQGGSSTQSPQWKNTRTAASSSSSPSLASAASSLKNLPQQQGRVQQGHTQISFGVNSKSGNAQHVHQIPTGNQSPSSPVVVGSPPTSVSKSAGGSPRASSTGNKMISAPSLSSQQQAKTSSSGPSRKSSPVGGRNPPSNLGNSHMTPAPCSTTKSSQSHHQQALHQQQQQQQQQQQKQALHQAQLFFSSPYMQAQSPQSNSSTGNTTGPPNSVYYQQRRQPPEQQQQQQLTSNMPSSGMLTLCPLTLTSTTSDPTKAVAAATAANMKGGLPPPGLIHAAQFATQSGGHPYMSTAFPYIHSVPSVQVKSGEQKQPTGNDNLH